MSIEQQPKHPAQSSGHLDITHGFVAILMGVSGTGKVTSRLHTPPSSIASIALALIASSERCVAQTTIGEMLGKRLDAQFEDADDFHSDGRWHGYRSGAPTAAA